MTTWAAIDVDYREQGAVVAAVVFDSIDAATPVDEQVVVVTPVAPYEPGAFFKRAALRTRRARGAVGGTSTSSSWTGMSGLVLAFFGRFASEFINTTPRV